MCINVLMLQYLGSQFLSYYANLGCRLQHKDHLTSQKNLFVTLKMVVVSFMFILILWMSLINKEHKYVG